MSEGTIDVELDEHGVLHVWMNRPAKKNALTVAMYRDLCAALGRANDDPAVRVVLWRGRGGSFTSGNDLLDFQSTPPAGEDSPVFQFLLALVSLQKPLVAAVEGAAIGIGVTGLLHCDLVYASSDTRFVMPFVSLGLVPEGASSLLLPQMAGLARASELLLLGEPFDAARAKDCGIVVDVFAPERLHDEAIARARRLADKPAAAVRASKALLRAPIQRAIEDALRREAEVFLARLSSPEALEAFSAFLEKRPPSFRQFE